MHTNNAASAPRHARIGDLLVAGGFVLPTEIDAASREQQASHRHLGEILVSQGELEAQELDAALRVQGTLDHHMEPEFRLDAQARCESHVRLGELLIEHGDLETAELDRALDEQRQSGRPLGDVLLSRGSVTSHQLDRAVGIQRRLLGAVFGLCLAAAGVSGEAHAATAEESLQETPAVSAQADTESMKTLNEILPKPDISSLASKGGDIIDSATVTLSDFAQNVSNLFERVEFSGMQSHFGAMDANTARDRAAYEVTDDAYLGVSFRINFSSSPGERGDREVNLNFVPDDL